MAKNPENYNPFYEEQHDEELRLYGKDKKARNYIPVENLVGEEKEILEQIPAEDIAETGEDYYENKWSQEAEDETRAQESEKRIEELKKQILEYHEGFGVASVHTVEPEEKRISLDKLDKSEKIKQEFAGVERENIPRKSRRKTTEPITSMSSEKVEPVYYQDRKHKRNSGEEHDNLKTFKKALGKDGRPKMERSFRQKIKDFFMKQINGETPLQKIEQFFDDYSFEEDISDPKI